MGKLKIVQSFWTKPLLQQSFSENGINSFSGWPTLEALLFSWALSSLTLNKVFSSVALCTDGLGKNILVDVLQLPYTTCKTDLDKLDSFDSSLWAIGKLYTYSIQEEPFLHIDGDIFVWEHFKQDFLDSQVVAQSMEKNPGLYDEVLKKVVGNLKYFPVEAQEFLKKKSGNFGINTGVFGGKNLSLIKKYSNDVISFIEKNHKKLEIIEIKNINMFYEQYLLLCFLEFHNEEITYLFDDLSNDFREVLNFHLTPFESKYIHMVGSAKSNQLANEQIAIRLRIEYPAVYDKIRKSVPEINNMLRQEVLP